MNPTRTGTRAEREAAARSPDEQRAHERQQVAEHYQNDPEIFRWVLGRTLAYSVGIFAPGDDDLERAQERKLARIRGHLDLQAGDHVLDVGCGWGSVLVDLLERTGASVRGITLSARQREVTLARAAAVGAAGRVRVDLTHALDLDLPEGSLDAVVFSGSIVHMHHRAAVHAAVGRWLKPGGRVLISDCYFPRVPRGERDSRATHHIFVTALGYCRLIPLSEELAMMEEHGIDVRAVEDLTASYVRTVDAWVANIRLRRAEIEARAPGFSRLLQTYMLVGRTSFARRTALEYMILGTKGGPEGRR